jgi:DEAD_2.
MFNLGKKMQSCPYYASKKLAPFVDVICIPYICLLHDKTREQLKIPLKNSIIIVDECHNFMEALYQIYSFSLTYRHLAQAFSQITAYKEKFKKRLKQKTLLYIDQIVRLLNSVMTFLKEKHKAKGSENQSSHQLIDFLIDLKLDKYDFFKLEAFIQDSQISKKILGYSEKQASTQTQIPKTESSRPSPIDEVNIEEIKATKDVATLERFLEFLIALIRSNDSDSRLIVTLSDKIVDSSLKIVNMEPARYIDNILKECISMIFAGGTLQPVHFLFVSHI